MGQCPILDDQCSELLSNGERPSHRVYGEDNNQYFCYCLRIWDIIEDNIILIHFQGLI